MVSSFCKAIVPSPQIAVEKGRRFSHTWFCGMDYCISSVSGMRNHFQKVDLQGRKPFCKRVFPLDPLSENS